MLLLTEGNIVLKVPQLQSCSISSARTNLKVGAHVRSEAPEIFFVVPFHYFGSTSTIGRLGERFRDGQYSLVSFLLAVFSVPSRL